MCLIVVSVCTVFNFTALSKHCAAIWQRAYHCAKLRMLCHVYIMICVILYALSRAADIVQSSIRAAIQIKPLLSLYRQTDAVPRTRTNYNDRFFAYRDRLPTDLRTPDITLETSRNKLKTCLFTAHLLRCPILCYTNVGLLFTKT